MSITNVTIARIEEIIDNKDYLPFIGQIEPLSRIPDWIKPLCRNCKNGNILLGTKIVQKPMMVLSFVHQRLLLE